MSPNSRLPSRFFTPPQLRKLNLDLVRLDGKGVGPAQFDGETHDGREVYCRYRNGWLSIYIATTNPVAMSDEHEVLSVKLGPPLHGGMTLGQLCNYAGLTINGTLPPLPTADEMIEAYATDLGGDWSFYDFSVGSSHLTQRNCVRRIVDELGDCHLVGMKIEEGFRHVGWLEFASVADVNDSHFSILRTKQWDSGALCNHRDSIVELFPDAFKVSVIAEGFASRRTKSVNTAARWVRENHGPDIKVAGACEEMSCSHFALRARYRTEDVDALAFLQSLNALLDEVYPATRKEWFDVASGERLERAGGVGPTDPEIAKWAAADSRHWCSVFLEREGSNFRAIGVREVSP